MATSETCDLLPEFIVKRSQHSPLHIVATIAFGDERAGAIEYVKSMHTSGVDTKFT